QLQTGDDASVTLSFADDSRLQLRENSLLQLDQLSSYGATGMVDTRMRLQRGRSSNQVTPARGPASRYIITAPTATSSVRGTLFRVNAGDHDSPAATEVLEGHVQVGNQAGKRMIARGQATLVRAAGVAPAQPQPLLPAPQLLESQLRLQPLPLLATWQAMAAARRYRVEVVLAAAPDVVLFAREVAEPQIQIDSLPPGHLRLLVRAIDADDVEGLDAEHDFSVPEGLPAPLTLAPLHGQTVHQLQPRFQWAKVAGATGSVLQIADNASFLHPLIEQQASNQQLRIRSPLPAGSYFWRLASLDGDNNPGRYGQALPLQISDVPVATPLDSEKNHKGLLTLRWPADSAAQHYRVQISRKADFSRLLLDEQVDTPEIGFKQPWRGGTLHVRV
ncbi:MAG: FecR family protein, partial [Stenotrophomonas sp.]